MSFIWLQIYRWWNFSRVLAILIRDMRSFVKVWWAQTTRCCTSSWSVNNRCIIHNHLEHVMGCISVTNTARIDWDQMWSQASAHIRIYSSFSRSLSLWRQLAIKGPGALFTICSQMLFFYAITQTSLCLSVTWMDETIYRIPKIAASSPPPSMLRADVIYLW